MELELKKIELNKRNCNELEQELTEWNLPSPDYY